MRLERRPHAAMFEMRPPDMAELLGHAGSLSNPLVRQHWGAFELGTCSAALQETCRAPTRCSSLPCFGRPTRESPAAKSQPKTD